MAFKKGKSGNPNGRPKGALNKKTQAGKPIKQWFLDKNIHPLDLIMKCLDKQKSYIDMLEDPKDQVNAWNEVTKRAIDMLPYVAPKVRVKEVEPEEQLNNNGDLTTKYQQALDMMSPEELKHAILNGVVIEGDKGE